MTEKQQLNTMTDRELVAYWNVMQFPGLVIGDKTERHLPIVSDLLTQRGIAH